MRMLDSSIRNFIARLLIVVMLSMVAVCTYTLASHALWVGREFDQYVQRAQVAATPKHMEYFLTVANEHMEAAGMTHGYTSLLVKSANTDMQIIRQNLQRIIARTRVIQGLEPNSVAYNTAMADLRGTVREFDPKAWGWWLFSAGGSFWLWFLIGSIAGIVVVPAIWHLITDWLDVYFYDKDWAKRQKIKG